MRRKSPSTDTVFFWVYICQRSVQDQFCNNSVVVDCLGIAFVNEWMNRNEPESSDLQAESARPNRGAELEADCVGLQKLYCVWNSCSIHNPAEVEFEPDTNKKKMTYWPSSHENVVFFVYGLVHWSVSGVNIISEEGIIWVGPMFLFVGNFLDNELFRIICFPLKIVMSSFRNLIETTWNCTFVNIYLSIIN